MHMRQPGKGIQEWIHVHPNIPVPLLSYRACRELALIPEQFPNPITQVTHAAVQWCHGAARQGQQQPPRLSTTSPVYLFDHSCSSQIVLLEGIRRRSLEERPSEDPTTAYGRATDANPLARGRSTLRNSHSTADSTRIPRSGRAGTSEHGGSWHHRPHWRHTFSLVSPTRRSTQAERRRAHHYRYHPRWDDRNSGLICVCCILLNIMHNIMVCTCVPKR